MNVSSLPLSSARPRSSALRARLTRGFTLVELLVVIGIMVVLAGLMVAALPGIQARMNRQKIEVFIAELGSGLSRYEIDHGIYPQNPGTGSSRDQAGLAGAEVLYKHLSGDWSLDGKVDSVADGAPEDQKVYVEKLAYEQNRESRNPRTIIAGGSYMIVDAFGDPIRYIADPPNVPQSRRSTINPTYDLWSIAGAHPTDPEDQAAHITNWQQN